MDEPRIFVLKANDVPWVAFSNPERADREAERLAVLEEADNPALSPRRDRVYFSVSPVRLDPARVEHPLVRS